MANYRLIIVNPISGGKSKNKLPDLLLKYFKAAETEIFYTERAGQGAEIASDGLKRGIKEFIAVGGDGTVNELARSLVGTDARLGIIPFGSGNGLARHNKIPMNIEDAIRVILNPRIIRIDTCRLNQFVFVNMAGVGFDAHVGKLFADTKNLKRGFSNYLKTILNEFRSYQPAPYRFYLNGETFSESAFMVSFANSSQYGNNAFIAPHADMTDGMMDVCVMKKFPLTGAFGLGLRLFTRTIDKSGFLTVRRTNQLVLERENEDVIHVDGEPFYTGKKIEVTLVPHSLSLMVPG